jgi:hypothetical protein
VLEIKENNGLRIIMLILTLTITTTTNQIPITIITTTQTQPTPQTPTPLTKYTKNSTFLTKTSIPFKTNPKQIQKISMIFLIKTNKNKKKLTKLTTIYNKSTLKFKI